MQTGEFVAAFREAFGPVPELPLLFRYTDEPLRPAAKAGGCFFKLRGRQVLYGFQPHAGIRPAVRLAQGAL